jgi:uncharacterized protein (TIGR04255 family)
MNSKPPRKHYKNAPISEAVIDIQVHHTDSAGALPALTVLADQLKPNFPTRLPIHQLIMEAGLAADSSTFSNDRSQLGWRLNSKNNDRVLQIKTTGITYSHLPPYSNWDAFSAEATTLWEKYSAAYKPKQVIRRAVRVINRVPLHHDDEKLESYLTFLPQVPDQVPAVLKSVLMRIQVPMTEVDPQASLILGLYTSPDHNLMLDIDLFVERPCPPDEEVFKVINILGEAKDVVFEACITDKMREKIS